MTFTNIKAPAAPAKDAKLNEALAKAAAAQTTPKVLSPEEIAAAARDKASAAKAEPPKPVGDRVIKDAEPPRPTPVETRQPHQCQSFVLNNQRFKFLVECPDCHWQARCMTEHEVAGYISQHAAHKAGARPF